MIGPGQDELARLEAERDQLLSMIAYHERPQMLSKWRAPAWLVMIAMAIICCVGILIVAGIIVGQISAFGIVFLVVALPLFAYVSGWKIEAFGNTFRVGEIVVLLTGGFVTPMGRPVGETEALQRLADCEARILKLREVRP